MSSPQEKPTGVVLVLKREREKRGLSLRDLSKLIGVDRSTISYWEHGLKTPRERNKLKLVRVFGVKIEELLAEDTE